MGTWGYGPLESDEGSEWMEEAGRPVVRIIKKALTRRRLAYDDVRAASVLLKRGYEIELIPADAVAKLIPYAIDALESIGEIEYAQDFDDPAAVQKSVRKQVEELVELHEELPED